MTGNSMAEVLAQYAATQPEHLFAADSGGGEYTYAHAWETVCRWAHYLSETAGVKPGERVMAECCQDVLFLLLDLACEMAGAVFVPIEGNASDDRRRDILRDTEAVLWVTRGTPLEGARAITYAELLTAPENAEPPAFPASEAAAELLFTTGTTGASKGILITNRANVALAENILFGVEMKSGNTELIPVPISHSHGLRCCYANLLNGGTIVLADGLLRVKSVFELMEKYAVTALDVSPSAAMLLIRLSKGAFWEYGRQLDYIQLGTAALPEELKVQLLEELPGVRLYNFYGSTESGRSCVLDFSAERGRRNCIGRPTKNAEIVFTDEERNVIRATEAEPGLLASRGPMNMAGYWKNEGLTATILRDGYIFSNDLGYVDEEGFVYVFGRRDDVINYNGIKIAPEEIEEVAVRFEGVRDAACVPQKDAMAGQVPALFIALQEGAVLDGKVFNTFLSEHLDGNKMPKRVEIIDEIPRTFNGKIRRKDLIGR